METKLSISGLPQIEREHIPTEILPTIADFFDQYEVEECENEIWNLLSGAFSSQGIEFKDPTSISNSIFFCKNLNMLLRRLNSAWRMARLSNSNTSSQSDEY